jgi:hypothetical protein
MSCHGFFLVGYKEFGSLLITHHPIAVNISTFYGGLVKHKWRKAYT